ncbi:MAG TPA: c-type cytochrome [Gemmatimonadales bacterium]|nr:c-type cytochrome [Gemmatimonadales bacterium]
MPRRQLRRALPLLLLGLVTGLGACEPRDAQPPAHAPNTRAETTHAGASARVHAGAPDVVVPFRVPADSEMPAGEVGAAIRRGRAMLVATRESLPAFARSGLQCVSCHPAAGTTPNAMPWVGVYARFPQYRSRSGTVQVIEDRVNDCFLRSLNGRALPPASREMRDIVAYFAFLSQGVPVGARVEGQGLPTLAAAARSSGDTTRGAALFAAECARCHGDRGQGSAVAPPLWGARSFNVGAGMARLRTAAAFIRHNMPRDRPGTLTDAEAVDVAAYVVSRPRPDFAAKAHDWPNGDPPPDVAYPTTAAPARAAGPR